MLRRERYAGRLTWGKVHKTYRGGTKVRVPSDPCVEIVDENLRIVSDDQWNAVQQRIASNQARTGLRGPKGKGPRYFLTGYARCGVCGGPINATSGRAGTTNVGKYVCAWHRTRGNSVCPSSLHRPVSSVDAAISTWIQKNILKEELIAEVLKEVRRRLAERSKKFDAEIPALQGQIQELEDEVRRLGEALLSADKPPQVVLKMIEEREWRLESLKARLATTQAAPSAIDLETRRMEREARERLQQLRSLLERNPVEARKVLDALLDGPLTLTPTETSDGKRFRIEGTVTTGALLAVYDSSSSVPRGI
jgi:hypothetical protein